MTSDPLWAAKLAADLKEANATILELQRDLCRYAGVPMPSERQAFAKARNAALEEAAKVADGHAIAADDLVARLVAKGSRPEDDLPYRVRSVASQCRAVATAIRALKQEGIEGEQRTADSFRVADLQKALALVIPMAECAFNANPNPSSDEWEKIATAKAVLAGVLAVDPEQEGHAHSSPEGPSSARSTSNPPSGDAVREALEEDNSSLSPRDDGSDEQPSRSRG